jgi:hypothetical protein
MAAMSTNGVRAATDEWNAAHYRLDDYLRAHGVRDRLWQSRLVVAILEKAQLRHQQDPSQSPMAHTYHAVQESMEKWFRSVRDFGSLPPDRLLSTGKLYLHLTDAMERWPAAFLSARRPPATLRRDLRAVLFIPNPELDVSVMVPREPDLAPPTQATTSTWGWWWFGLLAVGFLAVVIASSRGFFAP